MYCINSSVNDSCFCHERLYFVEVLFEHSSAISDAVAPMSVTSQPLISLAASLEVSARTSAKSLHAADEIYHQDVHQISLCCEVVVTFWWQATFYSQDQANDRKVSYCGQFRVSPGIPCTDDHIYNL